MKKRNLNADLKKLARAFYKNLQVTEGDGYGIGLDTKRPFGNSYIEGDLMEIIGMEPAEYDTDEYREQEDYVRDLYLRRLIPFLKKGKSK